MLGALFNLLLDTGILLPRGRPHGGDDEPLHSRAKTTFSISLGSDIVLPLEFRLGPIHLPPNLLESCWSLIASHTREDRSLQRLVT